MCLEAEMDDGQEGRRAGWQQAITNDFSVLRILFGLPLACLGKHRPMVWRRWRLCYFIRKQCVSEEIDARVPSLTKPWKAAM